MVSFQLMRKIYGLVQIKGFVGLIQIPILLKITKQIIKNSVSQDLNLDDLNRSYTFYIIKNSENLADSAAKISFFDKSSKIKAFNFQ